MFCLWNLNRNNMTVPPQNLDHRWIGITMVSYSEGFRQGKKKSIVLADLCWIFHENFKIIQEALCIQREDFPVAL